MDDSDTPADSAPEVASPEERVMGGIGVTPGIVIGNVHRYHVEQPTVTRRTIEPSAVEAELTLLEDALRRARQELDTVHSVAQDRLDEEGSAILEAQELMLRDDEVLDPVRRRIEEKHQSAAYALSTELRQHRERLEGSGDSYLQERARDLEDLETRLLQALERGKTAAEIEPNSIVVANQLTAADVIRFSRHGMLGFVTARGGETSHVSIVARALNLPAIVGVENATSLVTDRDRAVLDGHEGRLVLHPTADTLERYRRQRARREALLEQESAADGGPTTTTDGHTITLRATVDFGETLDDLARVGADGIGLMRTEVLFLRGEWESLAEDRQVETYCAAAEAAGDAGATIRLLDVGGDKMTPFALSENNPFLGWRGIRVLLDRPNELLRPQLRALLRANRHGSLRALVPMVAHLDEVQRVRAILDEEIDRLEAAEVPHDPNLPLGVMVEVPSVALQAPQFAEAADFLSLGTNDLTQYVLAVDRGNDRVAGRFDALHPAVLQLVARTVESGRTADTPVTLCGEIASDLRALPVLLGLGLETLSVPPSYLPMVRHVVTNTSRTAAEPLAAEVLEAPDAGTARRRIRSWCDEHYDPEVFQGT